MSSANLKSLSVGARGKKKSRTYCEMQSAKKKFAEPFRTRGGATNSRPGPSGGPGKRGLLFWREEGKEKRDGSNCLKEKDSHAAILGISE